MLPPGARTAEDVRMDAVPALGAHTDALLVELGFDAATIDRLHGDGAV
jgi:crotonobetainyl-CoA:carnitine CoA-transferase CaiB-like acyl-CoA transferase